MTPKPLRPFIAAMFGILALTACAQVAAVILGWSSEPPPITALQLAIGATATIACWGSWRRSRWAPLAAIGYGALTASLLVALPSLLNLPHDASKGLRTGAAAVLFLAVLSAAYLRSDARGRGLQ